MPRNLLWGLVLSTESSHRDVRRTLQESASDSREAQMPLRFISPNTLLPRSLPISSCHRWGAPGTSLLSPTSWPSPEKPQCAIPSDWNDVSQRTESPWDSGEPAEPSSMHLLQLISSSSCSLHSRKRLTSRLPPTGSPDPQASLPYSTAAPQGGWRVTQVH